MAAHSSGKVLRCLCRTSSPADRLLMHVSPLDSHWEMLRLIVGKAPRCPLSVRPSVVSTRWWRLCRSGWAERRGNSNVVCVPGDGCRRRRCCSSARSRAARIWQCRHFAAVADRESASLSGRWRPARSLGHRDSISRAPTPHPFAMQLRWRTAVEAETQTIRLPRYTIQKIIWS